MPKIDNGWVTKGQIADPAGNPSHSDSRMNHLLDERLHELLRATSHEDRRLFLKAFQHKSVSVGDLAEKSDPGLAKRLRALESFLRKTGRSPWKGREDIG